MRLLFLVLMLFTSLSATATNSLTIALWPKGAPGAVASTTYKESRYFDNDPAKLRFSQVTDPEIELFLAPANDSPTAAVLICPGGGYHVLAYDHEGVQVARFFNSLGLSAAVLKYRLPSSEIMSDKSIGPLQDAQEALRLLRRRSAEWNIDPKRIGVMGFSAGGHLAGSLSTRHAEPVYTPADSTNARPDFSILVYPVLSMQESITHGGSRTHLLGANPSIEAVNRASNELRVDADTPPAFLIHSQDDNAVPVENSIRYYQSLVRLHIPGELHIHEKGGHGYGLGINPGSPTHWTEDLIIWLKTRGILIARLENAHDKDS